MIIVKYNEVMFFYFLWVLELFFLMIRFGFLDLCNFEV